LLDIAFSTVRKQVIIIMASITSAAAEIITEKILSTYDGKILAISIIESGGGAGAGAGAGKAGNILASKSSESFKKAFGPYEEGWKYGGTLAIAALSIANEVRGIAGDTKAITTTYEKCKMMLIPIPSYEILVGFVLQRRVVIDEERLASQIEGLVADNASATNSSGGGDDDDAAATERA
jgi:hypothetical protein